MSTTFKSDNVGSQHSVQHSNLSILISSSSSARYLTLPSASSVHTVYINHYHIISNSFHPNQPSSFCFSTNYFAYFLFYSYPFFSQHYPSTTHRSNRFRIPSQHQQHQPKAPSTDSKLVADGSDLRENKS